MYQKGKLSKTSLKVNEAVRGETIEAKIRRIMNNGEGIEDGAPLIFTDREDGVRPEHNIRTDRFELAVEAQDQINKKRLAQREERMESKGAKKESDKPTDGGGKNDKGGKKGGTPNGGENPPGGGKE